jgi:hypothetical protein
MPFLRFSNIDRLRSYSAASVICLSAGVGLGIHPQTVEIQDGKVQETEI